MTRRFQNLDALYLATLDEVQNDYEYENSPRGNREREIIGYSARIDDPRDRFCLHRVRKQNIAFNYAEVLWYLSGRNDLDFIEYYAPRMSRYSADRKTLPGTGYGARLLNFGPSQFNQIERAYDILSHDDPDSKRVFLQIFDAGEDIYRRSIDVSCTIGLQLLLRDEALHMVSYMRANDAYLGLLSDIFSFTFIQELMASMLNCDLGTYTHTVGSIHIYDTDRATVDRLLKKPTPRLTPLGPYPVMPKGADFDIIEEVLSLEYQVRHSGMTSTAISTLDLPDYWIDIVRVFQIYRHVKRKEPLPTELREALHPYHRILVDNRWVNDLEAA